MTILGAHVLAPDLAVAWIDSEVFAEMDNRSVGLRTKLAINPAGFVLVMAGWSSVASRAGSCAMDVLDFSTALERLPGVLRRASEQAAMASREPDVYCMQHAALIGFDRKAGAMVAYRMMGRTCFVAELDFEQSVPEPMPTGILPHGPFEVQTIACRQLERLRQFIPHARGGPLHVAVIRPDSITCNRQCDLGETAPVAPVPVERVKETA